MKVNENNKGQISIKQIILLQAIILIYTLATVAANFAAQYEFLSAGFIISYGIEMLILGIYAICWQQMIKRFDLSVAYANRAFGIFWTLIWAVLFFKERITVKNVIGIVIIFIGILVVNGDTHE